MKKYVKPIIKRVSLNFILSRCSCSAWDDNPWVNPIPPTGRK